MKFALMSSVAALLIAAPAYAGQGVLGDNQPQVKDGTSEADNDYNPSVETSDISGTTRVLDPENEGVLSQQPDIKDGTSSYDDQIAPSSDADLTAETVIIERERDLLDTQPQEKDGTSAQDDETSKIVVESDEVEPSAGSLSEGDEVFVTGAEPAEVTGSEDAAEADAAEDLSGRSVGSEISQ